MKKYIFLFSIIFLISGCNSNPDNSKKNLRSFVTSFESVSDFDGFYIVNPGDYDSSRELTDDNVYDGEYSHKAWILKARADNNDGSTYLPHRAYPTIQFQKTEKGVFRTPCLITLMVNLNMTLNDRPEGSIDDWFSFITLTPDISDNWIRTVLVNITPDNYIKLVHVPNQGEQNRIYQANSSNDLSGDLIFPYNQWVRIDIYIDFDATKGYAKVWQNRILVSHANVEGGNGTLAQAHFGLYSSAAISSGSIYNDKLRIKEVADENEAASLVNSSW